MLAINDLSFVIIHTYIYLTLCSPKAPLPLLRAELESGASPAADYAVDQ